MPKQKEPRCQNKGMCCMRVDGYCTILTDTHFPDNRCHFRKALSKRGPNCYDLEKKREKKNDKKRSIY